MNPAPSTDDDGCEHGSGRLSIDDTLEVLVSPRRRQVVDYFTVAPTRTCEFDDLVDHLARRPDGSVETVGRDRLRASLHHVHLPILAEKGVLEYDPRSGQLRYRPDPTLEGWLRRIEAEGPE